MQSLLDQVNILIKMKVGDPYRLEHIKLMLKQKRTVYGSDRAYLDKLIHEYKKFFNDFLTIIRLMT